MNKELYIEIKYKLKKLQDLSFKIGMLEKFLKENENNFKREESINALNKIKEYYILKKKEIKILEQNYKELITIQTKTCNHEISIKKTISSSFYCLICGKYMGENQNEIEGLSIDTTKDYEAYYIIEKHFEELLNGEEDILDSMVKLLETLQYEKNIRLLRR